MSDRAQRDALISERVLESMRDGVVSIDLKGRIITFNTAAGRILGKTPSQVLGQSFAEEFLAEESFDDFNEVVFKAIYEAEVTHSVEIALKVDGKRTDLMVASSFLTLEQGDGETEERLGVVVVFSDTTEERKRRKIKRLFGEYVDPRIVERILSRDEASRSRHAEMTISFVDMRNFTGWSERLDVDTLIDLLNRFLAGMTEPIGQAGGITDKYIGDSVMACWGPPFTDAATQAVDACKAALGQMAALPALRDELAAAGVDGADTLDAVVGLATGGVIAGDVGPPSSRNYTVIGNAVNLAARLQEAAKVYGQSIIVSEETMVQASGSFVFRELDKMLVRGLSFPTSIYALLGPKDTVGEETMALAARYSEGLTHLRAQNFGPAREAFAACLASDPHDVPSSLMMRRIDQLQEYPLPADWDGVWRVAGTALGTGKAR